MRRFFAFCFAVVAVLFFLLISAATKVRAHSWYDNDCCNLNDCRPVANEDVEEIEGGWRHIPTGSIFKDTPEKKRIRPSHDRYFHVCIGQGGTPYCIYILQGI